MKPYLVAILFAASAAVLSASENETPACACGAGGECACPAGECACGAMDKETCTCATGGACKCPAGECKCGQAAAAEGHPLKGVIVEILADKKALLVKHEEIPGVMAAMTMMFRVDDATLASAKKGEAITARMTREGDTFWLRGVKPADS